MFAIPTLQELSNRTRKAFRDNLPGSDAWLWPNNLYATAKVFAGLVYEVFGFADYIQRQKFAGTADSENLELHAYEVGLARRPAGPGYGKVSLVTAGDLTVAADAVFSRLDGARYIAQAALSLVGGGTLEIPVVAAADGQASNAEAGTPLDIVSGVTAEADTTAEVAAGGIVGGVDVEPDGEFWTTDLSTLRGRVLFRKRNPPHGGAPADYVRWATELAGVTRVFVEPRWIGAGSVRVFPLMDDIYANGIPASGDIERIADYIATVAPAGAVVTVQAASAVPIDITISGLSPDTTAVRDAVTAELRSMFRRNSRVAGVASKIESMPYLAYPFSFPRGWIWQAVGNAGGVISDEITAPAADVVLTAGQIATLGTVSFV